MKGTGGEMPGTEEMAKLTASAGLDEHGDLLEDGSLGGGGPESSNDGDGGSIAGGSDCGSSSPGPPPRSPLLAPNSMGLLPKMEGSHPLLAPAASGLSSLPGQMHSLSGLLGGAKLGTYPPPHHPSLGQGYLSGGQPLPPSSSMFGGISPIVHGQSGHNSGQLPSVSSHPSQPQPLLLSDLVRERVPEDAWQNYMLHFDNSEGCGFQVSIINTWF